MILMNGGFKSKMIQIGNVWLKNLWTNHSSDTALQFVQFFLIRRYLPTLIRQYIVVQ